MSFVPLDIPPGVVKTRSGEGATGRWNDANNVRFVAGKPRKRAGYQRLNPTTMDGKARGMRAWNKTNGGGLYAVGTNTKLYGSTDGVDVINITPLHFQGSWANVLSTTINKGAINVLMTAHGFSVGKQFLIYGNSYQGGSNIGGLLLTGVWELVQVVDANNFKIYPTTAVGTLGANPFSTTNLSPTVTVTHAGHGRVTGDTVWLAGATAVAGLTITGDFQITVVNANSYTINAGSNANATTTGGGTVTYHYGKPATSTVASGGGTVPYTTYLTNPFTTTLGSADVTVTHAAHGAITGDNVVISGAAAVGGITPNGPYAVTVLSVDTYKITHSAAATSGATGGGAAVLILYEISPGPADKLVAIRGFGQGPLGAGPFGASGGGNASTYFDPRTWAISSVGEDAVACPLGGSIYYWDSSLAGRADVIPSAPTNLRYAFMTDERFLTALGANGDPMAIAWASQDLLGDWVPTATNTANNSRRVREGSVLMAGTPVGAGMNLIWTDTACYQHQFTGSSFVYDTSLAAIEAGLASPQAFAVTPIGVLWMSQSKFKMWAGGVSDIPNASDVESWVYENIDPAQKAKCFANYDPINNSVDFFFVPLGASEPDWYVTVNLHDYTWVNGQQTRTTGSSFQSGTKNPLRVLNGVVYKHEVGVDADGAAADSALSLAPYEVKPTWQEFLGFDPNFKSRTGDIVLTLSSYDRNENDLVDTETETVSDDDEIVDFRSAGRHVSLVLSQSVLGGDWALDTPQIDIKQSARKR